MGNFDFLKSNSQFESFADVAIAVENMYHVDSITCVMECRKALDFAVKWMYSVDTSLSMPSKDTLGSLINTDNFKNIVGSDLFKRVDYIRRVGNNANKGSSNVTKAHVTIALENLHAFMDFISYCYGNDYKKTTFDIHCIEQEIDTSLAALDEFNFEQLYKDNKSLQVEFTDRRKTKEKSYEKKPLDLTEAQTRKVYIDVMLTSLGWQRGVGWIDELPIECMPNKSGFGVADYMLLDDHNNPLAVIGGKKSAEDARSRQQSKRSATESFTNLNLSCDLNAHYNCPCRKRSFVTKNTLVENGSANT